MAFKDKFICIWCKKAKNSRHRPRMVNGEYWHSRCMREAAAEALAAREAEQVVGSMMRLRKGPDHAAHYNITTREAELKSWVAKKMADPEFAAGVAAIEAREAEPKTCGTCQYARHPRIDSGGYFEHIQCKNADAPAYSRVVLPSIDGCNRHEPKAEEEL